MQSMNHSSFLLENDSELASLVPDTVLFLSIMGTEWRDVTTNLSRNSNEFTENSGDPPELVNGALNGHPIIRFSGDSIASSNREIIPRGSPYTIVTLARYNGKKRGRVFSSNNENWLFGFHDGDQDSLFLGKWFDHGVETDDQWHLHILRFNSEDQSIVFRSSGEEIVNLALEDNVGITSMGSLSLGGWGKNQTQKSQCDIAYLQVFDRAINELEIFQIEHAISEKFSLRENNDQHFIRNCSHNSELFLMNDKIVKYAYENCADEFHKQNLSERVMSIMAQSDEEYHKIASIFWEQRGDYRKALQHSYLCFFQNPNDFYSISRLMEQKLRVSKRNIFDWLLAQYVLFTKGIKNEVSRLDLSDYSNNPDREKVDTFSYVDTNLGVLNSKNIKDFFEGLDSFLSEECEEVSEIIRDNLMIEASHFELKNVLIKLLKANENNHKVLRYSTEYFKFNKRRSVGGFADRIKGITTVMMLAIATGRRFEIDWKEPFPLEEIFHPNEYDWRVRDETCEVNRVCLIDNYFPIESRNSLETQDPVEVLGIEGEVCEIYCNIYNHSCLKNKTSFNPYGLEIDFEEVDQSLMIGAMMSLLTYKPNMIESAIITNFVDFLSMFEDSIAIQFRTGGDGDWEDPDVDSKENVKHLINHSKEVMESSGSTACIFFASDSKGLKREILDKYSEDLGIFSINIPIAHIDRSEGKGVVSGSRFAIMENYLLSFCNHILTGKGAFAVISANRRFEWPWRYHKEH